MNDKKKIVIGIGLLCLVLLCGIFSYFKITFSYFGENLTGQLGILCDVTYYSNYPSNLNLDDKRYMDSVKINLDYIVKDIMFEIPINIKYEFSHWNTENNDSGTKYNIDETLKLTEDIDLYAIWKISISYGDINLDGVVNLDDSVLLDKYLKENTSLTSVILSNADVNIDGNIDFVDVDIIKQAVLGTKGYEELLSNKPVLIYDVYEGTINNNNNNGGNNSNNNGTGGSSTGSSKPSNNIGGSSNNDGSNTNNNSNIDENSSSNNNEEFKDSEKEEIIVDDNNIEDDNKNKKSYLWVFIVVILLITLRFIFLIIKNIIKIKKEDNNCDK